MTNIIKSKLYFLSHVFYLSAIYGLILMFVVFIGCYSQYLECNVDPGINVFRMLIPMLVTFFVLFILGVFYALMFLYMYSFIRIDHGVFKKAIGIVIGGVSGTLPVFIIKLIFFDDGYSVYVSTEYILCFFGGAITSLFYFLLLMALEKSP